jgi:hypothetical protein
MGERVYKEGRDPANAVAGLEYLLFKCSAGDAA